MSPIGKGGVYYAKPADAKRADVARQVVTATGTGAAWASQGADVILGKLVTSRLGDKEVQKITVKATGGKFKVIYSGKTTTAVKFNATAPELQAALIALSNIDEGDVVVTGGPGDEEGTVPYVLTWNKGEDVAAVTTDATELTGGEHKATVSTTTAGSASGSLKVSLETEVAGDWYTVGEFPEVTAEDLSVGKAFGPLGENCRWKWTLGAGDGARFAIQVSERND